MTEPRVDPRNRELSDTAAEYDEIKLYMPPGGGVPNYMEIHLDGRRIGQISVRDIHSWSPAALEALRRVEADEVTLKFRFYSPLGEYAPEDVPPPLREHAASHDIFGIYRSLNPPPPPAMTVAERRRKRVEEWAVANTTPQIVALAMVNPKLSTTADALASRKRHIGQIWFAYVTHILAAAQHEPWLEHQHIWPAIERALEIDAYEFMDSASVTEWNSVAGYMEAYSRIYRAPARYLTSAPAHVRLVDERPEVFQQLPLGAPAARRLIYGGDT